MQTPESSLSIVFCHWGAMNLGGLFLLDPGLKPFDLEEVMELQSTNQSSKNNRIWEIVTAAFLAVQKVDKERNMPSFSKQLYIVA